MFSNTCVHAEDDLLGTGLDLTGSLAAKMKIALSLIPGSGDNIGEFMKKVDEDVSHMSSLPSSFSKLSVLGQVLKSTKDIMDQFSQVVHISSLSLIMADKLIEVIRYIRYSMHRGLLFPVFTR